MKLLFSLVMMLPLLFPLGPKSSGKNDKPDGPSTSYEFSYNSTMMYPITYYKVSRDETGAVRIGYLLNHDHEVTVIPGPEDIFERIDKAVADYKLHKLKNSYWPRMQILDGYGWHAYIRFQKRGISSGGSNAWPPKKIYAGISSINNYIKSVIDASTEEDVLFRQDYQEYRK